MSIWSREVSGFLYFSYFGITGRGFGLGGKTLRDCFSVNFSLDFAPLEISRFFVFFGDFP